MGRVEIIVIGILHGGFADSIGPGAIPTGNKQGLVQIGRIGHRVLLVHQNLIEQVGQFGCGRNGHTAQVHLRIEVSIGSAGVVQVSDFARGVTRRTGGYDILVAHEDDEGGGIGAVAVADEGLDGRSRRTRGGRIVNGGIDTFLLLPDHPILERGVAGVGRIGDDDHLHWCVVEVRVVSVDIQDGPAIEQLFVDDVEIRAISADELVLGGLCVSAIEEDFHFDVVEDTQRIVDGVVADGVDAHLTDINATHGAINIDVGTRRGGEAAGLVSGSVVYKRNILRIDVLTQRRLTRHQGVDAIVFETVVGNAIARHFDARSGSDGNGNQFVDDGDLRIAFIATDDGVRKANPREKASVALVVLRLNRGEGERSLEAGHVAFDTFGPRFAAQGNVSVLGHGEKGAHG